MGRSITEITRHHDNFVVVAGVVSKTSSNLDDVHTSNIPMFHRLTDALSKHPNAVVIDFSVASQTADHVRDAKSAGAGILVGTTGYGDETRAIAEQAAQSIPVVLAPNTSLMSNLMRVFTQIASARLPSCDVSILDIHHAQKKDAPSGTAQLLASTIASENPSREIEIRSMRKGNVPGEHTVYFFGEFDRLELCHRVTDRRVFAEGALVAAQFLFNRVPGLYDMNDVLNLDLTIKK